MTRPTTLADLAAAPGELVAWCQNCHHNAVLPEIKIADCVAIFTMHQRYSTVTEALAVVQPFVEAWEIWDGIHTAPGDFTLRYAGAEIIGQIPGLMVRSTGTGMVSPPHTSRENYPQPNPGFVMSNIVKALYWQYAGYRKRQMTLGAVAYFCLDVMEDNAAKFVAGKEQRRSKAAKLYNIDIDVLKETGDLSSSKGGRDARKAGGIDADFTREQPSF